MLLIVGPPVSGERPDESHVEGVVGHFLTAHEARLQVIHLSTAPALELSLSLPLRDGEKDFYQIYLSQFLPTCRRRWR